MYTGEFKKGDHFLLARKYRLIRLSSMNSDPSAANA